MFLAECTSNLTAAIFSNAMTSIVPQSKAALPFISGADGYILGFMYVPGQTENMALPQCCIDRVSGILREHGVKFEYLDSIQEFDADNPTFTL